MTPSLCASFNVLILFSITRGLNLNDIKVLGFRVHKTDQQNRTRNRAGQLKKQRKNDYIVICWKTLPRLKWLSLTWPLKTSSLDAATEREEWGSWPSPAIRNIKTDTYVWNHFQSLTCFLGVNFYDWPLAWTQWYLSSHWDSFILVKWFDNR